MMFFKCQGFYEFSSCYFFVDCEFLEYFWMKCVFLIVFDESAMSLSIAMRCDQSSEAAVS